VCDSDDIIVYASEGLVALAGVPSERICGQNVRDGFSEDTLAEFLPYFDLVKSTGLPVYYDRIHVATPSGRQTVQSGWLIPADVIEGACAGVVCTVSDVTGTRDAESELVVSRERWHTLLSLAPVGICETSPDGICQFVNQQYSHLTGRSPEETRGREWSTALHPDDRTRITAAWDDHTLRGAPFDHEYRYLHPDGSTVWVRGICATLVGVDGHVTGHLGVVVDISDRQLAAAELERERARAEHYLDAADMILVALNGDGVVTNANHLARRMFDAPGRPLLGCDWFDRALPDVDRHVLRAVLAKIMSGEFRDVDVHENPVVLPGGEVRLIQWHNSLVEGDEGRPDEVLALGIDVTELRNAEALRIENEAKDRFLANMSHELRTPLNSIIGFSSVLLKGLADPLTVEQDKQISFIHQAGVYLLDLVNDLLDVEQVAGGHAVLNYARVDWNELVTEVVNQMRPQIEAHGLHLGFEEYAGNALAVTDARRVRQIVHSLLGNALKFTQEGAVTVQTGREGGFVFVSVADTGIGIRAEDLERIFELYYQAPAPNVAKSIGAGLGLPLSRSYARLLGGDLVVASVEGGGVDIYVECSGPARIRVIHPS